MCEDEEARRAWLAMSRGKYNNEVIVATFAGAAMNARRVRSDFPDTPGRGLAAALVVLGGLLFGVSPDAALARGSGMNAVDAPAAGDAPRILRTQGDGEVEALLSAILHVRMRAVDDARSNATLGRSREGTGVLIDDRGHVLTIGYLVIEPESIELTTAEGKTVPARLVGYDPASGFGLLQSMAPLTGAKPIALGSAAALQLREPVMIVPYGGRDTASVAYVVSKRAFTGSWEYMLDSAIFAAPPNLAWAGAALVNRDGELVGIGSLLVRDAVESGTVLPGNMFVPIDLLKPVLADLIDKGRVSGSPRPWMGLGTEEVHGHLLVTRISAEGPAYRAGMKEGDIVLGVDAQPVRTQAEFYRKVWVLGAAGVEIPLRVLQGTEVREIRLKSIDRAEYFREKPRL